MPTPLLMLLGLACSGTPMDTAEDDHATPSWSPEGSHPSGTTSTELEVEERAVPIRVWYPASGSDGVTEVERLVDDPENRTTFTRLLSAAPAGCSSRQHTARMDAPPASVEPAPVVLMSHCHTCVGLSNATIATWLARHGFIVVAPDHTGNTLFDEIAGDGGTLDEQTLQLRATDLTRALDAALEGSILPSGLIADPTRIGVLGHSFGAVTAARVLDTDPRVTAAMAVGAPIDNPLLQGAVASQLEDPVFLLLLEEDNSILQIGNDLIESNFDALAGPAWLGRIPDAGHWSTSDICGLIPEFQPGCGDGERQTDGSPFVYPSADDGRATAGALAVAFFASVLEGDEAARSWLAAPRTPLPVDIEVR